MASSWRSTGLAALDVVVSGASLAAATKGTDALTGVGTGIAYPELRPPDYRRRFWIQTAVLAAAVSALALLTLALTLLVYVVVHYVV